ncbi:putative secreted protein [Cryptosporidium canis]|uniref:Secreted protein n=1 Tax=Cryptosporidium canis TaxID=195482 RepID=A0ABQ8P3T0_9CRYT|nr:putative secreted protein [Cryptosporidium canis]
MLVIYALLILSLLSSNVYFVSSNDSKKLENGAKYYSYIVGTGLPKLVDNGNKLLHSDDNTKNIVVERLMNIFFYVDLARSAIHDDKLNIGLKKASMASMPSNLQEMVHVPKEKKTVPLFHRLKMNSESFELGSDIQFHIPRIKYLKKTLPRITVEPYQRIMSFSIEVCMIPSLWYLELIHCMYMGMAPYFTGMLMSYSLQDVVGAAIMSIGYKDESFSLENCYFSVSLVADTRISNNYVAICNKVEKCLSSKPLSNGPFRVFRTEFENRIKRVYSLLKWGSGDLDPIQFARYSLLFSLSFVKDKMDIKPFFPERNFLPVRMMISSLGLYCLSWSTGHPPKRFEVVETLAKLISGGITSSLDSFDIDCPFKLLPFFKAESTTKTILADSYCKAIFSFGFIDESIAFSGSIDRFKRVTKPSRILLPSYHSIIPSMQHNVVLDKYGVEWMNFVGTYEAQPCKGVEGKRKIFKSRKLRRTKKANPKGIKNGVEHKKVAKSKRRNLSEGVRLIFNKSKRVSNSIENRVLGE